MGKTVAEKFEEALTAKRDQDFGLRTLARLIAGPDATHQQIEVVRRRLHKYRPKPGSGGVAEVVPTAPTRHEIEDAMGLERDALAADPEVLAALASPFAADMARVLQAEVEWQVSRQMLAVMAKAA